MVSGCNAQWSQMFVDENDGTTAVRVCYWEYIRRGVWLRIDPFRESEGCGISSVRAWSASLWRGELRS